MPFFFFSQVGITLHYHAWKVMHRYRKADEELRRIYSSDSVKAQGYALNHKQETID